MKAGQVHLVPLDEGTIDVLKRIRPLGVPVLAWQNGNRLKQAPRLIV